MVFDLGLVNFTTKVHIIIHHMGYYMRTTKESLYSADTSATESTHSGLKNLQRVHNLLSTHFLGTPGQQYRLKRSLMRYNWGNLPFDMRQTSTETTDKAPAEDGGSHEQDDLSIYVQDQVEEMEEEAVSDKQVASVLSFKIYPYKFKQVK